MAGRTCYGCLYYEYLPSIEIEDAEGMDFSAPPSHICWAEPTRIKRQVYGSPPPSCRFWTDALRPDALHESGGQ